MTRNPDQQVLTATAGLGMGLFAIGVVLIPLFLPAFILYRIAVFAGITSLHPAIMIVVAGAALWGLWRLGGILIRSLPWRIARAIIAAYIGACYAFAFFQRELTTARSELDVTWLIFTFAIFAFIGWKVGGALVLKAHRDRLIRARRNEHRGAPEP